ncbi:MAG TPA: hypothetical protein VFP98_07590, partial [Candidatus Polarisedimenticolia bacterium]|nr:hypothetical protein [Candidatus Polarisedimenticolia bacterium]
MADQETAEKSSARFRRRSVPALLLAGALLGIVLLSVRRVAPVSAESPSFQVRRWLTGSARTIPPGFVLAPPLLSRLVA